MSEDGYTRITLRIPNDLHGRLTAEAARTSKSMNAEIVARLGKSFDFSSEDESSENLLVQAWLSWKEHVEFLEGEVREMERLDVATPFTSYNKNFQPPGWTPPDPLPEWASLKETLVFYRGGLDFGRRKMNDLNRQILAGRGLELPTKP